MAKKTNIFLNFQTSYNFWRIEEIAQELKLYEKRNGELVPFDDELPEGGIGDITLPLYFEDGTLACNFVLTGFAQTSYWRCIYVCKSLSPQKIDEV